MNSTIHDDAIALKAFTKGLTDFIGRGGSKQMAATIAMKESAFSRFINAPTRHFDTPTLLAYTLMLQTRSEGHLDAKEGHSLTAEGEWGPFCYQEWRDEAGNFSYTWHPKQ